MKLKFKSEKTKKKKHINSIVLKENEKKSLNQDGSYMTFKYLLTYFIHTYLLTLCNSFITKYIEIMFLFLYCFYIKYITLYLAIATSHVF